MHTETNNRSVKSEITTEGKKVARKEAIKKETI